MRTYLVTNIESGATCLVEASTRAGAIGAAARVQYKAEPITPMIAKILSEQGIEYADTDSIEGAEGNPSE